MNQRHADRLIDKIKDIARRPLGSLGLLLLGYVLFQFIEKRFWEQQPVSEFIPELLNSVRALADDSLAHVFLAVFALLFLWQGGQQALEESRRLARLHDEQLQREAAELAKPIAALLERYDRRLTALQDYIVLQDRQKVIEHLISMNEEHYWEIRGFTSQSVRIVQEDEQSPMARDRIHSLFSKISDWQMKVQIGLTIHDWFSDEDAASINVHAETPHMSGIDEVENLQGIDRARYADWIVRQRAVANLLKTKAIETREQMQTANRIFRQA